MKQDSSRFLSWPRLAALALALSAPLLSSAAKLSPEQQVVQHYYQTERQAAGLVSKSLKIGNITWRYNEGGDVNRPTILLLHGFAGHRDNWNRVAKFLTPFYHVIIPDLPNTGETQSSGNFDLSVPSMSAQLRQLVETLNIADKLNIAGHSLGGSVATVYAAQYPFDTQSLFLLNSAGIYKHSNTPYTKDPLLLKNLVVTAPGDLDHIAHQLMQNPPKVPEQFKSAQEKLLISRASQSLKFIDQMVTLNRIYTPDSFARLTRNIEAPTLILWGKHDKIINVEVAKELQGLFKRAETPVILNNVGHVPMLEAEQQVVQHYLPFLAKTQNLKNPLADKLIPLN
ncbi:alpha/beta fold hydrolase [Acinetobacter indicus]|uniref:alpha/beta fold hydrolase n=1 Tax=Acinetobacter indicus TaxID=756892 RepID=UPI0012E2723C|nr:alpha/beta hydrolase [Acinetobacter indicus]